MESRGLVEQPHTGGAHARGGSILTFGNQPAVLVIGDVMLDHYVHGHAGRLSPEAPVPVLAWRRDQHVAGGAANVAANIAALDGAVRLAGVVGSDRAAEDLASVLVAYAPALEPVLIVESRRPTTLKTRFVSNGQQLLRLDREDASPIDGATETELLARVLPHVAHSAIVVLSDYRKGVLSEAVVRRVIAECQTANRPVVVDPKRADWMLYRGATLITPNRAELEQATGLPCGTDAEVEVAGRHAQVATGAAILVTRSERGMTLVASDQPPLHIAAHAREVFDVSGAGDTVVAVLAAVLAGGASLSESVRIANVAAGLVVTKHGTATLSLGELNQALRTARDQASGAISLAECLRLRTLWRDQGQKVGFTNGCFDILHPGHIQLLSHAGRACDRLIVALNTDASVRRLKGPARPVQSEVSRSTVMAALACVDAVLLFDEDTPLTLIQALQPDLLVKGADYREDQVVGADVVKGAGGRVMLVDLMEGQSTTGIVTRSRAPPT